jgi:hypothetical protein
MEGCAAFQKELGTISLENIRSRIEHFQLWVKLSGQ